MQVVLTSLNDNGQVPVLELHYGTTLSEPNAITWYVTQDSEMVPVHRLQKVQTLQWMYFAQDSHEPYIVTVRFSRPIRSDEVGHGVQIHETNSNGYAAIGVIERRLATRDFFSANIAVYACAHLVYAVEFGLYRYAECNHGLAADAVHPRHIRIEDRTW